MVIKLYFKASTKGTVAYDTLKNNYKQN